MAARASWKGFLKLSLVTCPVALYSAVSSTEKVAFKTLNGETGNRLKQQYVDSETGDVVENEDRVKGYEVSKNQYVVVTEDELADLKIESSHNIEISKFVPADAVDPLYVDSHYYLAPDGKVGEEAFSIIRAAMEKRKVVGVAQVVLFGKERVVTLEPKGKGIKITSLKYGYEVRQAAGYFDDIEDSPPSKEMLDLALHLVDNKLGEFDPAAYKDRYQDAVISLIRAKQDGRAAPAVEKKTASPAIDLMAALRASLGGQKAEAAPEPEPQQVRAPAKKAPAVEAVPEAKAKKPSKASVAKDYLNVAGKVVLVTEMAVDVDGEPSTLTFDPPVAARVAEGMDSDAKGPLFAAEGPRYEVGILEAHEAFAEVAPTPTARGMGTVAAGGFSVADAKAQKDWAKADVLEADALSPEPARKFG